MVRGLCSKLLRVRIRTFGICPTRKLEPKGGSQWLRRAERKNLYVMHGLYRHGSGFCRLQLRVNWPERNVKF